MKSRTGLLLIGVVALLLAAVPVFGATINVPEDYASVQAAVDAAAPADVIVIAAGTYTEQVHIQTSDLALTGSGVGSTIIKSPASLPDYFATSYDHYPVVFIDGATGVTLSNLTVDGDRKGNSNYKFEGISFWNADGAVTDVEVLRVTDDPFSGVQHGVGIYSYNDTGGPYAIVLTDVLVDDYQKTAVALLGSGLTVDMTRVVTIGEGATTVTAQNGIQTGYGSGGTLTDCEVYGNWYVGDTWTGSGFLLQGGAAVDVSGMVLSGNQTSIYAYDNDCSVTGSTATECVVSAVIAYASGSKAGAEHAPLLPSPVAEDYSVKNTRAGMSLSVDGCTFTGTYVADEAGIFPYCTGGTLTVDVTNSDVSHWDFGLYAYEGGGTIELSAHGNSIHDNGGYAAYMDTAEAQDFEENWWGDADGPSTPVKAGGAVNEMVDYSPWYAAPPTASPIPIGTNDSIQDAIDAAGVGATVSVFPGTYEEQLTINKSLTLTGAGENLTTVTAPAADRPGAVANGTDTWDYILAAFAPGGTIDVRVEGFTFDGNGESKSEGTSGLVGVFMRDVIGVGAGLYSCTIENFAAVEYESWGVRVYGDSDLTLDDNTLSGYTRDGITVNGDDGAGADPYAVVSDNDLTGSALCLNGILVGYGGDGLVTGNTVRDHTRSSPWAAVGIYAHKSDGVDLGVVGGGNHVENCKYGIFLLDSDGSSVAGNTLLNNLSFDIGIDASNNNQISSNVITASTTIPDKAISISGGSTGNVIGGPTPDDGNTIVMPTSGGLLYGIYVVGTTGSGSNSVQYNDFTGGTRFVQVDGGNSGTTTVADNTARDCSFAGVYLNAGSAVITGNTLTNTVRPIEFWGATDVTISNNYIDGSTFEGINAGAFSGTVTVTGNAVVNTGGKALWNRTGPHVDASGNYWGVTDPDAVALDIDGVVDYTPWLGGGTADDPGFTGDYSVLYVDDDSEQTGSATRIQEGIDLAVGSTVYVMDGVYGADPVTGVAAYITHDGMSLIGESEDGTIIDGSIGGVGTSGAYWPKGVHVAAGGVTVRNLTVSGFSGDAVNSNGYGVLFRDYAHDTAAEGYVFHDGCTLEDVTVSECYSSVYALVFTNLTVSGCSVSDSASDGIFIARECDGANVTGNEVVNSGNQGIWVGYDWTATGPSDNVSICDNRVDGAMESGIAFVASDGAVIERNNITNAAGDGWSVGALSLKDGPSNVTARYNVIHGNDGSWNGFSGVGHGIGVDGTPSNIVLTDNSVFGNSGDGCHNYSSVDVDATHTWWGDASGPAGVGPGTGDEVSSHVLYDPWIGKSGGENIVCDPDPLDLTEGVTSGTIDVEYLGGGGGMMYGYSVTVTWDDTVADLTGITQGTLLSDAGTTQFFVYGTGGTRTIDCVLLGAQDGVTGPGTMFTLAYTADSYGETPVDITVVKVRDKLNQPLSGFYEDDGLIRVDTTNPVVADAYIANLTLSHTDDYAKDHDYLELTATVTDDYPLTGSDITADFSALLVGGGTAVPAEDYSGSVATWTVALEDVELTADGVHTVTITVTDGLGNVGTGSDGIVVDNTPPDKVTGFVSAPAHEEVILSWNDASGADANYYGVLVRYAAWGDYPLYDTAAPAYPADETAGDGEAFSGDADGGVHSILARDIYYYSAFVYDWALNYSVVDAGGQDRATNYWLGDVATSLGVWGYNGLVNGADIDKLGGTYGGVPSGDFLQCDVGPTDDYSRLGIPEPDDFVSFEDLMMFAMNYGVVSPRIVPFLDGTPEGALMLTLKELRSDDDVFEVALSLAGNAGEVKGISTVVEYDPAALEFVGAQATEDMYSPLAPVFFWSGIGDGTVQVDLAVLGTGMTIGGSGEVAVLTFRPLAGGCSLAFLDAVLRGADNEDLTAELGGLDVKPEVPSVFRLVQNTPNPFNPVTTVAYDVPRDSEVSVRVYDVAGRLVRTLVDGVQDAGAHQIVWDGRSDRGESVGSGIYFCVMEAPGFRDSRKMTLLK